MNPWPVAWASLRRRPGSALLMVLLVALAVAGGTAIGALDRAGRQATARAADAFDLVVGAPGGAAQLVLAAVYLQPDAVPLLDPATVARVMAEPGQRWVSPIGFGDSWRGSPVVGVAPAFIDRGGTRRPAEGRGLEAEEDAVVGAAVPLRLGDTFKPSHGVVAGPGAHVHEEVEYRVVGRLPPTGTAWDGAILVPIESVWELHGLGNGHEPGVERVGPPWERPAGVPAIVLAPRDLANAYQLRARYRTASSTAVFPGEVLAALFRVLGNVRAVLSGTALAAAALVTAAVFLAFAAAVSARLRELAVLRAIGAPPAFVVGALWLELGAILVVGAGLGLLGGWAGAAVAAGVLGRDAGLAVSVRPGWAEAGLALGMLAAALVAAAVPALLAARRTPASLLKR